jgi:hypothetical protein
MPIRTAARTADAKPSSERGSARLIANPAAALAGVLRLARKASGLAALLCLGHVAAAAQPRPSKPDLMLVTGLPIIWGEGGAFDPQSRPAASYRMLEAEFRVRPLDVVDDAGLTTGRLLLLAQPRALAPAELVALDAWVRRGGRVLILTDPRLVWPSSLPLGDIRRPPPIGLLDPLLTHWGLRLEQDGQGIVVRDLPDGRRLRMAAPGKFIATKRSCATQDGLWARCRLGSGDALLLADADLMHDSLWTAGDRAAGWQDRTADNGLLLSDRLDALAGVKRERIAPPIDWQREPSGRPLALLLGVPALLIAAAGATLIRLRRA